MGMPVIDHESIRDSRARVTTLQAIDRCVRLYDRRRHLIRQLEHLKNGHELNHMRLECEHCKTRVYEFEKVLCSSLSKAWIDELRRYDIHTPQARKPLVIRDIKTGNPIDGR